MYYLILILLGAFAVSASAQESKFAQALEARFECALAKSVQAPALPSQSAYLLRYRLCVEKSLSASQRDVLRRSFEKMIERMTRPAVYTCYRRQTKKLITPGAKTEHFSGFVNHFFGRLLGSSTLSGQEAYVFLSPQPNQDGGWGRLVTRNDFFDSHEFAPYKGEVKRFVALGFRESAVASSKVPFGSDVDFWAMAIGTALLHAQGAVSDQDMPARSPLHEVAKCLLWSGQIPVVFQTRKELDTTGENEP